jgi:hypothetical protein
MVSGDEFLSTQRAPSGIVPVGVSFWYLATDKACVPVLLNVGEADCESTHKNPSGIVAGKVVSVEYLDPIPVFSRAETLEETALKCPVMDPARRFSSDGIASDPSDNP